jgi:peptidoglycan/xylan/chitin deacetylase (PgdA/CDA1 family)
MTAQSMPRLDRLISLYLGSPLLRLFGGLGGSSVPVLAYHSISENLFGYSHPYYQINTSPTVFIEQMKWLRNAGYRTIDLAEAWANLTSGKDLPKTVVITFDDGYRDFYTEAMDVLKQCDFTATIFLVTGRIRQDSARIEGASYLTWREVRELHAAGIRFGSHTETHPDLRSLDPELLDYELGRSKEVIEQNLGAAVDSFSYPFSFPEEDKDFTRFLEDLLKNLGFEYGVSTILGRASEKSNRFFLPRLPINNWDDTRLLQAKIEGGYDWVHWPQLLKKSLLHNGTIMQPTSTRMKKVL